MMMIYTLCGKYRIKTRTARYKLDDLNNSTTCEYEIFVDRWLDSEDCNNDRKKL